MRFNEFGLAGEVQLAIVLVQIRETDGRERLEAAAETAFEPFRPLGDTSHDTVVASKKDDYPIGFRKRVGPEYKGFCFDQAHGMK